MQREAIHGLFLERLFADRPRRFARVRVVSRLCNSQLLGAANSKRVFLFVPDLHLLSAAGEARYRYAFGKVDRRTAIDRTTLLKQVVEVALEFRDTLPDGVSLKVVQLGDFLDLWRERERDDDSVSALVDRIAAANRDIVESLMSKNDDALSAQVVVGNHDLRMRESTLMKRARTAFRFSQGGKATLLVTHGDAFDPIETALGDGIQEWAVEHFGRLVGANDYAIDRRRNGDSSNLVSLPSGDPPVVLSRHQDGAALAERVNVWQTTERATKSDLEDSHALLPRALASARVMRRDASGDDANAATLRSRLDPTGTLSPMPELRAMVVGHSHHPRISVHCVGSDPSENLVVIDCGAWLENSDFRLRQNAPRAGNVVPSCHIGVICGGDARIYQLDPKPGLSTPI